MNFLANCEKDFDSHLHHILHLDDLLARDARHCIQLGYPVLNYPRYIPTTVELCRSSFPDIINNLKADLTYFKDDFQNEVMFKGITRPTNNKSHPGPGNGTSTPSLLDASMGGPGSTTPRGNPPPWMTPVPSPKDDPSVTSKKHPCPATKDYPYCLAQKHTRATTMTSTLT